MKGNIVFFAIWQKILYNGINAVVWNVRFTKKALKKVVELPEIVQVKLGVLILEIEMGGPIRGNWKNYGKLGPLKHHCHLKSGRPTYVVCWEQVNQNIKIVEIYYVGTHEKAPY